MRGTPSERGATMVASRPLENVQGESTLPREPKAGQGTGAGVEALRVGLMDAGLSPLEESARLRAKSDEWHAHYRPENAYDEWLVDQAVMLSVRLDRCRVHDWALRMLAIERAE